MARETYTTLTTTSQDLISASSGSLSGGTIAAFIALEINKAVRDMKSQLDRYVTFADDYSFTTVASTQAYDLPADFNRLVTATLSVGGVAYTLRPVESKYQWNRINEIDFSGTTIPQFIFLDHKSFSIYPTPADAYTGSMTYIPIEKDMDTADYTTGTVTLTNGDATVEGAGGATWTADFVGRWLKGDVDGNWYKIASFTDADTVELDADFQGTTGAGLSYTIGESPGVPVELHELIPHRVASQWYSVRKDFNSAQSHLNFYRYGVYLPTGNDVRYPQGGIEGAKKRYARRTKGHLIYRSKSRVSRFDEQFSTTLSSTI
jgi:hypothetical protein